MKNFIQKRIIKMFKEYFNKNHLCNCEFCNSMSEFMVKFQITHFEEIIELWESYKKLPIKRIHFKE